MLCILESHGTFWFWARGSTQSPRTHASHGDLSNKVMHAITNKTRRDMISRPFYVMQLIWPELVGRSYNESINTLRPRQHGRHFADDNVMRICLNENVMISIKIPLKFVPHGPINNIPAQVQIMAWRRSGDKPLSEPMLVYCTGAYICVTRLHWVNRAHLVYFTIIRFFSSLRLDELIIIDANGYFCNTINC